MQNLRGNNAQVMPSNKKQNYPHNFLVDCLIELLPKTDQLSTGYVLVAAGLYIQLLNEF